MQLLGCVERFSFEKLLQFEVKANMEMLCDFHPVLTSSDEIKAILFSPVSEAHAS